MLPDTVSTSVLAMSKKIKIQLSEKSIADALRQVQEYKNQLLNNKVETFVRLLAQTGLVTATQIVNSISDENYTDDSWAIDYDYKNHGAVLRLRHKKILFIEFSAGITYGTSSIPPLPSGKPYGDGYGMGTYNPASDNWQKPGGWFYRDDEGHTHHTKGTAMLAPMGNAEAQMLVMLRSIAKQVFGGGD